MSEADTRAKIMAATIAYEGGEVILTMTDEDHTKAEFTLHPLAAALLSITLQPAIKMALADMEKTDPSPERGFPDTLEGL